MILYIFVIMILASILGGAYYAYRVAFYSSYKDRDKLPAINNAEYDPYRAEIRRLYLELMDRPFEIVSITSCDGLQLYGKYYHFADGAPLDICFHGYRSSPFTDFSWVSQMILQMGHNMLLVDQRAHGSSSGRTITFGIMERRDVISWVEFAENRFGHDSAIHLYGISMGGATVLMASGPDLPNSVKAIVADCPYDSPLEIILHVGRSQPFPKWLTRIFVILGAKIFGGFDLTEASASKAAKKSSVPILILHGEADGFVPYTMSQKIKKCNPERVRWMGFPDANHGISFLLDPDRYRSVVKAFLTQVDSKVSGTEK